MARQPPPPPAPGRAFKVCPKKSKATFQWEVSILHPLFFSALGPNLAPGSAFPAVGQHPRQLLPGDGRAPAVRPPSLTSACREGRRARRGLLRLPQTIPLLRASWSRCAAWPQHQAGIASTALCYSHCYCSYCPEAPRQIALCRAAASRARGQGGKAPEKRVALPWGRCLPQNGLSLLNSRWKKVPER